MKKYVGCLLIVLAITSCREKEDTRSADVAGCINLDEYYDQPTLEYKVKWLKEKGNKVCTPIIEEAVLKDHTTKPEDVKNPRGMYSIEWGDLQDTIGSYGYEKYLNVKVDADKVISLGMVDDYFQDTEGDNYCFSTALINALAKKFVHNDESKFQFSVADINNQKVVVIQVGGSSYYDYSTDPKAVPTPNVPL